MKCLHVWKKLAETTLPSGYEQMAKDKLSFEKMSGVTLFAKKYVAEAKA